MNNVERAAVILLGMDKDKAAQVLKHLDTSEIEKLARAMRRVGQPDQKNINKTIQEFMGLMALTNENKLVSEQPVAMPNIEPLLNKTERDLDNGVFSQSADKIYKMIHHEHPQVISVIISYLDSEKAAEILTRLDDSTKVDVIKRLARIGGVSPLALQMVDEMMHEKINDIKLHNPPKLGGAKTAAAIINYLDSATESKVIQELALVDQKLGDEIEQMVLTFEDISSMDDNDLKVLLKTVPEQTLYLALKAADDGIRSIFVKNVSKQVASILRDRFAENEPVTICEVIAAQKNIVSIAQQLARQGSIVIKVESHEFET